MFLVLTDVKAGWCMREQSQTEPSQSRICGASVPAAALCMMCMTEIYRLKVARGFADYEMEQNLPFWRSGVQLDEIWLAMGEGMRGTYRRMYQMF